MIIMNIQEATKKALEEHKHIQRRAQKIQIKPTDSEYCCLVWHPTKMEYGARWNPKAKDILADDWEVVC